ncbi:MAG: hypothetical protein KDA84_13980, partial [Planctomycetaceae bacterium]|nr:hypothetical protein [Planctomycetaceae bacterium]
TDLMYLVEYRFSPAGRTSLGQIQAIGRAKKDAEDDVRELFSQLADRGMKVKPPTYPPTQDPDYPKGFRLDLEIPLPVSSKSGAGTQPTNR